MVSIDVGEPSGTGLAGGVAEAGGVRVDVDGAGAAALEALAGDAEGYLKVTVQCP